MNEFKLIRPIIAFTVVSCFVTAGAQATLTSDIWTIASPASKVCLAQKIPSMADGLFRIADLEKSLSIFDCYPDNSPQKRAYSQLASIIFSSDYGGVAKVASSLRGKNFGLVRYFLGRLMTDDLFFTHAKEFYEELKAFDTEFIFRNQLIGKKPSLKDVAGAGDYQALQPGWLWNLALKHARQNRRVAMEILGICGHDDVHYEPYKDRTGTQSFTCPLPGFTTFYVPRSLGLDVDIADDMKLRVAAVQAPTKGMSVLPSKTYHIISSAFFSCLMTSQGLSNAEIEATDSLIARAYRVVDMRNRVIADKFKSEDPIATERDLRQQCKARSGICPDFSTGNGYDQEREDRFVAAKLAEFDSYFLIDRWKMFKKAPIIGLPIDTDFSVGEKELHDVPLGWSAERFTRGVTRLKTYAIDIEWTQQQHSIGSKFGQKVCQ